MLPVAVEVAPPDVPSERVNVLLAACSRAVAEADCRRASEVDEGQSQAVAIVTWHTSERVVVEVGLHSEGRPIWRSRTVSFNPNDDANERWRAVGFVVGTLARGGQVPEGEQPQTKPERGSTTQQRASSPARNAGEKAPKANSREIEATEPQIDDEPSGPDRGPPKATIELGAALSPAWSGTRAGGVLRTRWPIWRNLRSVGGVRYLEHPRDENGLRGQWFTVMAGIGAVLGYEHLEVSGGIDFRAEYFHVLAVDAAGRQDARNRLIGGMGVSIGGAWMPLSAFGLYVAADASVMGSSTELKVSGRDVGTDPAARFSADAGVRLRLW